MGLKEIKMFLLNKKVALSSQSESFKQIDLQKYCEIPIGSNHPGAFGYVRKNHVHEGVDIYANEFDFVYIPKQMQAVSWIAFTGEVAGSPWWHNTYALVAWDLEERKTLVFGEISSKGGVFENGFERKLLSAGSCIGMVSRVLRNDKGRPCNMVHVEMYEGFVESSIGLWGLNKEKPAGLIDPSDWLIRCAKSNNLLEE